MENNTKSKKNVLDWVVAGAALIALVICAFFWGCRMDMIVTILCAVLVVAGSLLLARQNKLLNEKNSVQ